MWYTVALGAFLNIFLLVLFDLRPGIHLLLGGVLSFFLATLISLIVLMDHPFSGEMGRVSLSIRAGLRSVDETLTKAIAPR
jgi:hypothetical protein